MIYANDYNKQTERHKQTHTHTHTYTQTPKLTKSIGEMLHICIKKVSLLDLSLLARVCQNLYGGLIAENKSKTPRWAELVEANLLGNPLEM